jgi:hypothetical protein
VFEPSRWGTHCWSGTRDSYSLVNSLSACSVPCLVLKKQCCLPHTWSRNMPALALSNSGIHRDQKSAVWRSTPCECLCTTLQWTRCKMHDMHRCLCCSQSSTPDGRWCSPHRCFWHNIVSKPVPFLGPRLETRHAMLRVHAVYQIVTRGIHRSHSRVCRRSTPKQDTECHSISLKQNPCQVRVTHWPTRSDFDHPRVARHRHR